VNLRWRGDKFVVLTQTSMLIGNESVSLRDEKMGAPRPHRALKGAAKLTLPLPRSLS
jgi:hypothetical protein